MADLLPCPFCASEDVEITKYGDHRQSTIYMCNDCGASLETGETFHHGSRWNQRWIGQGSEFNHPKKQWYHTDNSPRLNKSSLGSFFEIVLRHGGEIGQVWPFNSKYKHSSIYVTVFMTPEAREQIEKETKFTFKNPPTIKVN